MKANATKSTVKTPAPAAKTKARIAPKPVRKGGFTLRVSAPKKAALALLEAHGFKKAASGVWERAGSTIGDLMRLRAAFKDLAIFSWSSLGKASHTPKNKAASKPGPKPRHKPNPAVREKKAAADQIAARNAAVLSAIRENLHRAVDEAVDSLKRA